MLGNSHFNVDIIVLDNKNVLFKKTINRVSKIQFIADQCL